MRFLAALAILTLALVTPSWAQVSHFNPDPDHVIVIKKVTPRTGADILTPSTVPFFLEVEYRINSKKGEKVLLVSKVERLVGSAKRQPLIDPMIQEIVVGPGRTQKTLVLQTTPVKLVSLGDKDVVLAKVLLVNPKNKKEYGWSQSFNRVVGKATFKMGDIPAAADHMEVLNVSPPKGTQLHVGSTVKFTVSVHYTLKSSKTGFINFELGESDKVAQGTVWHAATVPVPPGDGVVEVEFSFFLQNSMSGFTLGLAVPFRADPLGSTVDIKMIAPYPLIP